MHCRYYHFRVGAKDTIGGKDNRTSMRDFLFLGVVTKVPSVATITKQFSTTLQNSTYKTRTVVIRAVGPCHVFLRVHRDNQSSRRQGRVCRVVWLRETAFSSLYLAEDLSSLLPRRGIQQRGLLNCSRRRARSALATFLTKGKRERSSCSNRATRRFLSRVRCICRNRIEG